MADDTPSSVKVPALDSSQKELLVDRLNAKMDQQDRQYDAQLQFQCNMIDQKTDIRIDNIPEEFANVPLGHLLEIERQMVQAGRQNVVLSEVIRMLSMDQQ